jgi:hypothetical protein
VSSLLLRDQFLKQCWVPADFRVPDSLAHGEHYPVAVLGVIDDPTICLNGAGAFVDVVAWWPALRKWTVTHQCRSDSCEHTDTAVDYPIRVTFWQPLPPLPF